MTNITIGKDVQLKCLLKSNEEYQYSFDKNITGSLINGEALPHKQTNKTEVYQTLSSIIPMPKHFILTEEYNKMFDQLEIGNA